MYYVGLDLGATNVRAVVGDGTATITGTARRGTPSESGEDVTGAILQAVREACADASVEPTAVVAAGVGAMGRLDPAVGGVRVPANLSNNVRTIPLVDPLAELLNTGNVQIKSDTTAGVIGERFYAHSDVDNLVYLTISSGIGAGVIADGNVVSGWNGNAGEIGHTTIDAEGFMTCGCGHDGHWEAYCSGNNIPRFARALHKQDADPVETSLQLEQPGFTAEDLFEHAGADAFADHVLERLARLNTIGITNLVHAYAPQVVSVGGAVALNNPEHILAPVRERLDEAVLIDVPEIGRSELGEEAVLKGALASAVTNGTGEPTEK